MATILIILLRTKLTKFCSFYDYKTFQRAKATLDYSFTQGQWSEKIVGTRLKGSEGETHFQVEGGVLLGANPHKCDRFLNIIRKNLN